MEPPPFDAVAVSVLVSATFETLCHVDKVGKSGLSQNTAGICGSATNTAHHIDRCGRVRHGLDLLDEIRIGAPSLVGDRDKDRLLSNARQVGNSGKVPLRRRPAVDKDRAVVPGKLFIDLRRVNSRNIAFPFRDLLAVLTR